MRASPAVAKASPDMLRGMIRGFAPEMTDVEAEVARGAACAKVDPARANSHTGYRGMGVGHPGPTTVQPSAPDDGRHKPRSLPQPVHLAKPQVTATAWSSDAVKASSSTGEAVWGIGTVQCS